MLLVQNGISCEYEMNVFMRLFFDAKSNTYVYTNVDTNGGRIDAYCEIIYDDSVYFGEYICDYTAGSDVKENSRRYSVACTRAFLDAAQKIHRISLPWGAMCGVRPAKTVTRLIDTGMNYDEAEKYISEVYGVSDEKCYLAAKVAENESEILKSIAPDSVSIYIGIPFCPSRCLYCSFVSTDIGVTGKYINDFVSLLLKEIDKTAEIIKRLGLHIENIYIGGGTPTTLDEIQLERLLARINSAFDLSRLNEFTLEAGRPDTITREKLLTAKKYGIDRISINPQTTKDETLKNIGRKHTKDMFLNAFAVAREVGFNVINTDLIAGLPGENADDFRKSIDYLVSLSPENITVHSMCIKRAASLRFTDNSLTEAACMNEMLGYAQSTLCKNGYTPYYMYRQKNISGNLENVGYAKPGARSFYNVNIMEEAQTIIALGGGGTTKIVTKNGIERIFNYKDPLEYIKNFDEILARKEQTAEILAGERR